uniref:Uncharacterized protein n=1 Tax=Caenorhabditis japonica TaxID=281687 RepID=A0A8R1IA72_CAEJA
MHPEKAALLITTAICFRNAAIDLREEPFHDDIPDENDEDYIDESAPTTSGLMQHLCRNCKKVQHLCKL